VPIEDIENYFYGAHKGNSIEVWFGSPELTGAYTTLLDGIARPAGNLPHHHSGFSGRRPMRDIKADWKRWSGAERVAAVAILVLGAVTFSSLLVTTLA